jgi:hypothetical protein
MRSVVLRLDRARSAMLLTVVLALTRQVGGGEPPAPPLTYSAIADTNYYAKPELPKLGPAGFTLTDPTFGCPMVRVSDEKTWDGPIHTPAGAAQNTWNTDSTLFIVLAGGAAAIPYRFDPRTMKVSRLPGVAVLPEIAGDAPFSYHDRDICWGKAIRRNMIVKYNFATNTTTDVVDVGKVTGLPVNHMGAFGISATDVISLTFGGPGQNRDPYLLVYDTKDGSHHLWKTSEGTIDGKPVPNVPKFMQHSSEIDRSGRYVCTVGPGLTGPVVWDLETGTVYGMAVENSGHRVLGYGDMVNDIHKWIYRTIDREGIGKPMDLMVHPAGEGYFAYDGHESWNNARPGMHVPVLVSTYHPLERGDPKCAWGDEVIAVATDGSGKVWRFAHHRSTVHMPVRGADEQRAVPRDRTRMAEEQPYNFWDTPRGNVSQDGRFFMFTSNWEETLGKDRFGRFRQDVFIVKLERESAAGAHRPGTAPGAPGQPQPSLP